MGCSRRVTGAGREHEAALDLDDRAEGSYREHRAEPIRGGKIAGCDATAYLGSHARQDRAVRSRHPGQYDRSSGIARRNACLKRGLTATDPDLSSRSVHHKKSPSDALASAAEKTRRSFRCACAKIDNGVAVAHEGNRAIMEQTKAPVPLERAGAFEI